MRRRRWVDDNWNEILVIVLILSFLAAATWFMADILWHALPKEKPAPKFQLPLPID
jgi:hypothetical protein